MPKQKGKLGGARPGAGRPKGSGDRATKHIAAALGAAMLSGEKVSPLEVMTEAMQIHYDIYRNSATPAELKLVALNTAVSFADKAAPYLHARLAATTISGDKNAPLAVSIIDDVER